MSGETDIQRDRQTDRERERRIVRHLLAFSSTLIAVSALNTVHCCTDWSIVSSAETPIINLCKITSFDYRYIRQ